MDTSRDEAQPTIGRLMALNDLDRNEDFDELFQALKKEVGKQEPWAPGWVMSNKHLSRSKKKFV